MGILAATQAVGVTLAVFALATFAILGAITPLSALGILLIVAPLRALIATEAPLPLPLDVGQITLIALIGFWLVNRIARNQALPRPRRTPLYFPLIGFVAATGITAFNALSLSAWLSEWLKWVQMLLLVAHLPRPRRMGVVDLRARPLRRRQRADRHLRVFRRQRRAPSCLIDDGFFRAFGTFGQPNPFGGFMGLLAPVALMAALGYGYRLWRRWRAHTTMTLTTFAAPLFYALASALLCLGVLFSWSRGSWLGFAVALGAMLFALPRKWWYGASRRRSPCCDGRAAVAQRTLPASVIARVQSVTDEIVAVSDVRGVDITPANYANVERLAHWQAALNMAAANSWFGVGFGNYEIAYPQYNLLNWRLGARSRPQLLLECFRRGWHDWLGQLSWLVDQCDCCDVARAPPP